MPLLAPGVGCTLPRLYWGPQYQPPRGCAREPSVLPALVLVLARRARALRRRCWGGRGAAAGGRRLGAHPQLSRPRRVGRHVRRQGLGRPGGGGQGHGGARRPHALPGDGQLPPARGRRPCSAAPTPAGSSRRRTRAASRWSPGTCPGFKDPARDYRRSMAAIDYRTPAGQAFDSFTLDIEASIVKDVDACAAAACGRSPGASAPPSGRRTRWARASRRRPAWSCTPSYWPGFPYKALADIYDVFVPMGYYTYHGDGYANAYRDTRDNIRIIREQTGRPGVPIHVIAGDGAKSSAGETTRLRARPARERRPGRQHVRLGDDQRRELARAAQRALQPAPDAGPAAGAAVRPRRSATAAPTARTPRRSSTRPPARRATGCCASASTTCRRTRSAWW